MKRVKERWNLEFPEQASFSMRNLKSNASPFQKEPEIRNLILVRNRNEIDRQKDKVCEDPSNHQVAFEHEDERDSIQNDRVQEANGLINENDNEQELRTIIRVEDKELENIFNQILQGMEHCTMLKLHPRQKLPKLKLIPDIEESANSILDEYLHGDENIPEITDKVYVMGKAIAIKSVEHVGQIHEMEKFVKFWGDIWEKDDRTREMPWTESVSKQLKDKITNVKEFNITEETLVKETKKRKNGLHLE